MRRSIIKKEIKERADYNVDCNNTQKIKIQTKNIAKHAKVPNYESVFGAMVNPFCHIQSFN